MDIHIITYRTERNKSGYLEKLDIDETMNLGDTLTTIIGYKIWESKDYIAIVSGFNSSQYINGHKIAKCQILSCKSLITSQYDTPNLDPMFIYRVVEQNFNKENNKEDNNYDNN
jgi:hypothetical protein